MVISKPRPGVVYEAVTRDRKLKEILEVGVFMYSMSALVSQLEYYILLMKFACDSLKRLCEREEA